MSNKSDGRYIFFSIRLPINTFEKLERMAKSKETFKSFIVSALIDKVTEDFLSGEDIQTIKENKRSRRLGKTLEKKKEKEVPVTEKPILRNYVDLSRYNK